jgi:hypothetical protein
MFSAMLALMCALLSLSLAAPSQDGFVGFFPSNCPSGWNELSSLEGRLLLLVNNSFQAGESVGFPLADREERTHTHAVSGSFPTTAFASTPGRCCAWQ